jgi:hypothetical protein
MRTKFFILLVAVFLLTSLGSPVMPARANPTLTPADPIQVGQIGGVTNAVALNGDHLYFNVGPRIVRMDIPAASPGEPTKPGAYSGILPGIPVDIKVANGFIYAAMGTAGVAIVDESSLQPVISKTLPLDEYASAVAVGPQDLYVAAGSTGIAYFDLGAGKNELVYQGAKTFASPALYITDVETSGGSLFASANNQASKPVNRGGVMKFDISSLPVLGAPVSTKAQIDVNALAISSGNVFAAADTTLYVLDVGSLSDTSSLSSTHSGTKIALSPNSKTVYLVGAAGIDVVDVSTLAAPVLKTSSPIATSGSAQGLVATVFTGNSSTFLYIADFYAGLSIASSPQTAPQTITLNSPGYVLARPAISRVVAGAGKQAFTDSNGTTLQTIGTSNITSLNLVGSGITPPTAIYAMTTSQNSLLAAAGSTGLLRYQISAGSEPSSPDSFALPSGSAYSLAVNGQNALVAAGTDGLEVVNIQGTMSEVGHSIGLPDFDSDFQKVDWQGNYAYIADGNGNFRIYDMTDPTGPLPTNGKLAQTGLMDVKVSGNFVFLACGVDGVKVADVTDKAHPSFITGASYATGPGVAQSLVIYNNYLFVTAGSSGVIILSIQNNGHLNYVTTVPTSGNALQLALVSGAGLYVATEYGGLVMIQTPLIPSNSYYFMPLILR